MADRIVWRMVRSTILALFVLFSAVFAASAMEYNTDRVGGNLKHFTLPNPDPALCQNACKNEAQCRAWTYKHPDRPGGPTWCWLKNSIPKATSNRCCVSGVERPDGAAPTTASGGPAGIVSPANSENWERNTDRNGANLRHFTLPNADPGACQSACRDDARCKSWTYVHPGVQGQQARCWLKNGIPRPTSNQCCISGVERGDGSVQGGTNPAGAGTPPVSPGVANPANWEQNTDRNGTNLKHFALPNADPALCQNACRDDGRCRSWTYVHPGIQGPQARCWIKNGIPKPTANKCCISGVERQ